MTPFDVFLVAVLAFGAGGLIGWFAALVWIASDASWSDHRRWWR